MKTNRWDNYRKANDKFPEVRKKELQLMLKKVNPQSGEIIMECGTGNGYLTFPIAQKLGKGKLITYDVTPENLDAVRKLNKKFNLPIEIKQQTIFYDFEETDSSMDKIISIASFHHYDNKIKKTGFSGRLEALKEFHRIIKKNGKIIIGDVGKNTISSKYFDSINNPKFCFPEGHPHEFLDKKEIQNLCLQTGFEIESYEVAHVPWVFDSEDQAKEFLHTIHNAKCSPEESLAHAKKYLKFWKENNKYYLDWELFYLIAKKK
ncbi:methyltransferase domain-containing protein [archaeon]|jgi:SAM-dependent methyltransferase|nr:methyltransferase domain-containing protein [archaeon]MBT4242213.1 methyltransferase domain-containing protein [archaeon]MBT4417901.1 methyltransferase domain-containing protein [archaeon]